MRFYFNRLTASLKSTHAKIYPPATKTKGFSFKILICGFQNVYFEVFKMYIFDITTSKINSWLLTTQFGINEPGPQTDKDKVQFSINYRIIKIECDDYSCSTQGFQKLKQNSNRDSNSSLKKYFWPKFSS